MPSDVTSTPGIGEVHLTSSQLEAMARRCEATASSLATGMAQLISRIEAISGTALNGELNRALQQESAHLNGGLKKVMEALDELAGNMSSASTEFGVQDQEAARHIRAAAAEVGGSTVVNVLRG